MPRRAVPRRAARPPSGSPPSSSSLADCGPRPATAPGRARRRRRAAVLERELAHARRELERQRLICERAYDAIDQVREELARLGGEAAGARRLAGARAVRAGTGERLSAALARLRAERRPTKPWTANRQPRADRAGADPRRSRPRRSRAAGPEPTAAGARPPRSRPRRSRPRRSRPPRSRPPRPWQTVAGQGVPDAHGPDASSAGRLLLALLPAQRAADPRPVAYDLVLGDLATARVTVSSASTRIDLGDTPRPMAEVDFRLTGDLAGTARLLIAGGLRAADRPPPAPRPAGPDRRRPRAAGRRSRT